MSYIGLPVEASKLLHEKDTVDICPTCGHDNVKSTYTTKVYEFSEQFHGDGIDLLEYYDKSGNLCYREVIQEVPWSSGPVVFLKLVDHNGNDVSVWSEDKINSYL